MTNKGICLLEQNQLNEAEKCFDTVLQKNKNNVEALEGKAFILLEQKYNEEALNLYEEAIKLNPSNENNLLGKVKCLKNIGKTEEILNIINEIKGIDKIEVLIKYDKIEEAEKEINDLLGKNENNINAIF